MNKDHELVRQARVFLAEHVGPPVFKLSKNNFFLTTKANKHRVCGKCAVKGKVVIAGFPDQYEQKNASCKACSPPSPDNSEGMNLNTNLVIEMKIKLKNFHDPMIFLTRNNFLVLKTQEGHRRKLCGLCFTKQNNNEKQVAATFKDEFGQQMMYCGQCSRDRGCYERHVQSMCKDCHQIIAFYKDEDGKTCLCAGCAKLRGTHTLRDVCVRCNETSGTQNGLDGKKDQLCVPCAKLEGTYMVPRPCRSCLPSVVHASYADMEGKTNQFCRDCALKVSLSLIFRNVTCY